MKPEPCNRIEIRADIRALEGLHHDGYCQRQYALGLEHSLLKSQNSVPHACGFLKRNLRHLLYPLRKPSFKTPEIRCHYICAPTVRTVTGIVACQDCDPGLQAGFQNLGAPCWESLTRMMTYWGPSSVESPKPRLDSRIAMT